MSMPRGAYPPLDIGPGIRLASGQYASYWKVVLFITVLNVEFGYYEPDFNEDLTILVVCVCVWGGIPALITTTNGSF